MGKGIKQFIQTCKLVNVMNCFLQVFFVIRTSKPDELKYVLAARVTKSEKDLSGHLALKTGVKTSSKASLIWKSSSSKKCFIFHKVSYYFILISRNLIFFFAHNISNIVILKPRSDIRW